MKCVAVLTTAAIVAYLVWCAAGLLSGLAWLTLWVMTLALMGGA